MRCTAGSNRSGSDVNPSGRAHPTNMHARVRAEQNLQFLEFLGAHPNCIPHFHVSHVTKTSVNQLTLTRPPPTPNFGSAKKNEHSVDQEAICDMCSVSTSDQLTLTLPPANTLVCTVHTVHCAHCTEPESEDSGGGGGTPYKNN